MTNTTENKRRATRKIKKFDFSDDKATVSLVGDAVGGAANGYVTLLTKSNKKVSEEFIRKASQITVTLSINEYLEKFFGIWDSADQELLARSLGFTTEGMEKAKIEMQEEAIENNEPPKRPDYWENEPGDTEFEKWVNYKLQSIEVMKSLHGSDNVELAVSNLSEGEYLQVLQDQVIVEKALLEIEKACKDKKPVKKNSTKVATATEEDNSTNVDVEKDEVSTSVVKHSKKENKSMTKEVQVIEQEVEVIAKAQFDEIQKAFEAQKEELQKALDLVKQFEVEKKEAIAKSRKEQLVKACGDKAEVIFKACGEATDEVFADVVKALADMQAVIEKSALFKEQGASVETEADIESPIAKALKARLTKQQ